MAEEYEQSSPESGEGNTGVEQDLESTGTEGEQNVEATPAIGEDAEPGQTTTPAEGGDVGVPSDEEISREEQEAHDDE